MVVWLFLAVPWVCLRFLIVVFPDRTHLLFLLMHMSYDVKGNLVMYFLVNASPKPLDVATSNFAGT